MTNESLNKIIENNNYIYKEINNSKGNNLCNSEIIWRLEYQNYLLSMEKI